MSWLQWSKNSRLAMFHQSQKFHQALPEHQRRGRDAARHSVLESISPVRYSTQHGLRSCAVGQRIEQGDEGTRISGREIKVALRDQRGNMLTEHNQLAVERDAQRVYSALNIFPTKSVHLGHHEDVVRDRDLVGQESKHHRDTCERAETSPRLPMTEVHTLAHEVRISQWSSTRSSFQMSFRPFSAKMTESPVQREHQKDTRERTHGAISNQTKAGGETLSRSLTLMKKLSTSRQTLSVKEQTEPKTKFTGPITTL